jgi:hypothetical protein
VLQSVTVGARGWLVASLILFACGDSHTTDDAGSDANVSPSDAQKSDAADASESCTPGQTRCSDSNLGVETCSAGGAWQTAVGCGNLTCVGGQCVPCQTGESQCNGAQVQVCSEGKWVSSQTCPVSCCNSQCVDTTSDTNNCGGCGVSCGAGLSCGEKITAFAGSQPGDWTANGNATYDANDAAAQLTDTGGGEAGTWVFNRPITIDDVAFQFDFYSGGGTVADGLAIMFESDGVNALGVYGGGLGIAGLTGFGVEMDEYDNEECLDDNANHIAIDSLTTCGDGVPTSLVENDSPGITISDGNWHTIIVHVANGAFTVSADGTDQFGSYAPAGFTNGPWYIGFGGGTGGEANVHLVRNVSATFTGGARCY